MDYKRKKSILRKCVASKIVHEKIVIPPKEPPLPSFRVDYTYPLETVGNDYVGIMFRKFTNCRNVEMKKFYLFSVIYTSTHAVHLEFTTPLLGLRRFIARRGIPNMIISGNFQAFKAQHVKMFCKVNSTK